MTDGASDKHFDAIIVGSGFGGSVTAYRLAEAGLSVCVLERGKAYPPGEFPRAPHRMQRNIWDPSEGCHPLGGCPMGRDKTEGVVNSHGAVFGCPPGLYVADGSVMPGPVGPNPSLTIAALADRFAGPIIERKGPEE
jgi:choline dehydrogenase-like flavoprotein